MRSKTQLFSHSKFNFPLYLHFHYEIMFSMQWLIEFDTLQLKFKIYSWNNINNTKIAVSCGVWLKGNCCWLFDSEHIVMRKVKNYFTYRNKNISHSLYSLKKNSRELIFIWNYSQIFFRFLSHVCSSVQMNNFARGVSAVN